MLDVVTAIRFDRRLGSGKTWPCLLSCARTDGEETEVVAKFSAGCERQIGGLVAEAIAAILTADLDFPIPEPLVVEFDAIARWRSVPQLDAPIQNRMRYLAASAT